MSQHDQIIDDDIGLPVRNDINAALAAIFSSSAGATEPDVIVPGQLWFDLSTSKLKIRNAANDTWLAIMLGEAAPIVYTKAEMDARFAPSDSYTRVEANARFSPLSYTSTELTAKFNPILDPAFAPAAAPTKKAHLDLSGIAAGTDRAILVPDKAGLTLGGWELIIDEEFAGVSSRNYTGLAPFQTLQIECELWPVSANAVFDMYLSVDNGANWVTAGVYYYTYLYANSTQALGGGTTGQVRMPLTIGNIQIPGNAVRNLVDLKLHSFNKARWTRGRMQHTFANATGLGGYYIFETAIGCASSVVNNAFRIDAAGVLFNGHMTIHGIRG